MRSYHLTNMYLSQIQRGIQTAHVQHEMAIKYLTSDFNSQASESYKDWAINYKVIIVLNGGYQSYMKSLVKGLESLEHNLAWDLFYEEEDAANGLLTNVGIILPEKIYANSRVIGPLLDKYGLIDEKEEISLNTHLVSEMHLNEVDCEFNYEKEILQVIIKGELLLFSLAELFIISKIWRLNLA